MSIPKRKVLPTATGTLDEITKSFSKLADDVIANPDAHEFLHASTSGNPINIGPRVISPEAWAKKQTERAVAAAGDWLQGVMNPTANPVEAAIKSDLKRKNAVALAESEGRWLSAMKRVNVDEMYEVIKAVGADGFVRGLQARGIKITRAVGMLQPMTAALAATIDAMPDATDADREKRLLMARRGMIEIGKKLAGVK